jgi:membrane-bound metal-dependent hydrolase YbcI (DUF457 family)
MPQRTTHVTFSLFLFVMLYYLFHISFFASFLIAIGAVFPDFDAIYLLKKWHRRLFHNLFALFFSFFVLLLLTKDLFYSVAFLFGFVSHLAIDFFTPTGVWLFWPLSKQSIKSKYPILITGKFTEQFFQLIVLFITTLIFFFDQIRELFPAMLIAFIITIGITFALLFEKRKHPKT